MTAARALRGDKDVSAANVEKVKRATREIGYYENLLAASPSSKRSDLFGVVVPGLSNIVFPQVMSGVTDYGRAVEYDVIRNILSWRPAGLIVARITLESIEGGKTESQKLHVLTPTISLGDLSATAREPRSRGGNAPKPKPDMHRDRKSAPRPTALRCGRRIRPRPRRRAGP